MFAQTSKNVLIPITNFKSMHMHGRRSLNVTFSPLKNVEYADQLKGNRAGKKCKKKRFSVYFNYYSNCAFGSQTYFYDKFLHLPLI